jgi:hypothetical protein
LRVRIDDGDARYERAESDEQDDRDHHDDAFAEAWRYRRRLGLGGPSLQDTAVNGVEGGDFTG